MAVSEHGLNWHRYWALKNAASIDKLPGMRIAVETAKKERIVPLQKMVGPTAPRAYMSINKPVFTLWQVLLIVFFVALVTPLVNRAVMPLVLGRRALLQYVSL